MELQPGHGPYPVKRTIFVPDVGSPAQVTRNVGFEKMTDSEQEKLKEIHARISEVFPGSESGFLETVQNFPSIAAVISMWNPISLTYARYIERKVLTVAHKESAFDYAQSVIAHLGACEFVESELEWEDYDYEMFELPKECIDEIRVIAVKVYNETDKAKHPTISSYLTTGSHDEVD